MASRIASPSPSQMGVNRGLLIVTVEVPGLSLGDPTWPALARIEWQVQIKLEQQQEGHRWVCRRSGHSGGHLGPPAHPPSGPQTPFLQPLPALGTGRQAAGGWGLPIRSPGTPTTRVDRLQAQGRQQAEALRHRWWEGPGTGQPRGPLLTTAPAATIMAPVRGHLGQSAALW